MSDGALSGGAVGGGAVGGRDPGGAAFDHVDELCADGPVVIFVDDAHRLDGASLTLLRRLVWASRSLPLAVLISTQPFPASDQLAKLVQQVQLRLALPPMDRMMVERLVFDTVGRWPGPRLRRILELAAGNPLFASELLRAYRAAGALADLGPDSTEARYELDLQATGIEDMVRAHLGQLDKPTRDVLAAMAVWGTEIGAGDLAAWPNWPCWKPRGAVGEAGTLARALWSAAAGRPDRWAAEIALDVARVAVTEMDRHFAERLRDDVAAICPARVSRLVHGMLDSDPDQIGDAVGGLAGEGRLTAAAFAGEELACAAAAAGDRDRAVAALEGALAAYHRFGAVPDRDRALGRLRALGIRRGPREAHRGTDSGWASLTATEVRVAGLMRDGLTNREIGTRLFVSPRTVQTHVSHILQKTGLRSRVEVARAAVAEIS